MLLTVRYTQLRVNRPYDTAALQHEDALLKADTLSLVHAILVLWSFRIPSALYSGSLTGFCIQELHAPASTAAYTIDVAKSAVHCIQQVCAQGPCDLNSGPAHACRAE